MSDKIAAKQRLIEAAITLICEGKKPSEITVAEITQKAGVGNGMVNYHFQTKDNLMKTAVKRVTVCAKKSLPEKLKHFEHSPAKERLAVILKEVMNFFAENAEIGKIAILDNLEHDESMPHLLSDVEIFNDCLKELYGDDLNSIWSKSFIIAGFLHYTFLKSNLIKEKTGFDFYDKSQRDHSVDNLLLELFHHCEGRCNPDNTK